MCLTIEAGTKSAGHSSTTFILEDKMRPLFSGTILIVTVAVLLLAAPDARAEGTMIDGTVVDSGIGPIASLCVKSLCEDIVTLKTQWGASSITCAYVEANAYCDCHWDDNVHYLVTSGTCIHWN